MFSSELIDGLSLNVNWWYWIGLGDEESEGHFVWLNGDTASTIDTSLWRIGQPNGGENENCCGTPLGPLQPFVNDLSCSILQFGICERTIPN